MIKIGLCDDIALQLAMLEDIVRDYFTKKAISVSVFTYSSGEEVLEHLDQDGFCDIYILDMILPGIKGIGLGRALRDKGATQSRIIYLTATSEYAVESYQVGAFFYMLKPIGKQKIEEVLNKALNDMSHEKIIERKEDPSEMYYEIVAGDGKHLVRMKDINYIDIENRRLCYHLKDGSVYMTAMLRIPFVDAVKDILQCSNFFLVGLHMVVNLYNVDFADKTHVTFADGDILYPSKSACTALYDALMKQ